MAFFQYKVVGDKGTLSTLLVGVSEGTVPALLAILNEEFEVLGHY